MIMDRRPLWTLAVAVSFGVIVLGAWGGATAAECGALAALLLFSALPMTSYDCAGLSVLFAGAGAALVFFAGAARRRAATLGTRVTRRALGTLGIASATVITALGCNAILGIDEGRLVSADAGAGGSGAKTDGAASGGDTTGSTGGGSGDTGGGAATGGTSSAGTGGAAGGAGGKGAGGAATGGGTGTGGAGAGGAGTGGAANGVAGEVRCGTSSCKLSAGQVCCVATATGDAHCSTSCDSSTQQKFACDGAEDCQAPTAECCYPNGATTAACAGACQGRVFCGADADCAPGAQTVCGTNADCAGATCTLLTDPAVGKPTGRTFCK